MKATYEIIEPHLMTEVEMAATQRYFATVQALELPLLLDLAMPRQNEVL